MRRGRGAWTRLLEEPGEKGLGAGLRGHRAGVAALGRRDGGRRCWSSTVIRSGSRASTSNGNSMAHCVRPGPAHTTSLPPCPQHPPPGRSSTEHPARHSSGRSPHPRGTSPLRQWVLGSASSSRLVPSPPVSPREGLGAQPRNAPQAQCPQSDQGRIAQLPTPGGFWSQESLGGLAPA